MRNNPPGSSSTIPAHVYVMELRFFIACVCLITCATQSFAADTDRAAAVLKRELGVTIVGGDGSSFEKAIIVNAANPQMAVLAGDEYIALRYRVWKISSYRLSIYKRKYYFVMTYDEFRTVGPFPKKKKRVFYFDMSNYYAKKSS
jgi:hypothetical protein